MRLPAIPEILTDVIKDADLKLTFERLRDHTTIVVGCRARLLRPKTLEGPWVIEHFIEIPISDLLRANSIELTQVLAGLEEFRWKIQQASRI